MSTIITKKQFPNYRKYTMDLAGRPLTLETGKLAELANAAVLVTLGGAVPVHAHDGGHDGHVVAEIAGEQGTDGPVDDPAGEDALLAGAALPAHEGAGDTAYGIHLLLKVHAEGEEVDAVPPVGAVKMGLVDGKIVVNPNAEEAEASDMDVTVVSTGKKGNRPEPWTRGSTPTSAPRGRISFLARPSGVYLRLYAGPHGRGCAHQGSCGWYLLRPHSG